MNAARKFSFKNCIFFWKGRANIETTFTTLKRKNVQLPVVYGKRLKKKEKHIKVKRHKTIFFHEIIVEIYFQSPGGIRGIQQEHYVQNEHFGKIFSLLIFFFFRYDIPNNQIPKNSNEHRILFYSYKLVARVQHDTERSQSH